MTDYIFQLARGTSAQWAASTRVLRAGEPGIDTDLKITKYGDGVNLWADLPLSGFTRQPVVSFVGDSITESAINALGDWGSRGFVSWAYALTGPRYRVAMRAASGTSSSQALASLVAGLNTDRPDVVHVLTGTNDNTLGVSTAASIANLSAIVATILGHGARVVIGTLPGKTTYATGEYAQVQAINRHIRGLRYAGLTLVDYHALMTDPSVGTVASGLTWDTTHPWGPGALLMGRALATVLDRLVPQGIPLVPSVEGAEGTMLTRGRFTQGADGVIPTGWQAILTGGATYTRVARTDSIRGNWFQVTKGSESTSTGIRSNVSLLSDFGVVPGDTLEAALEFQVSGMNPSPTLKGNPGLVIQYLDNANTNISSNTFMNVVTTDDIATSDRSGMYYLRSVVPATASITKVALTFSMYATGVYRFDRALLRKAL